MLSNNGDGQGKIIFTDGKYSVTTVTSSSTSGLPSLKAEVEGGLVSTSCVIENVDDAKFSPIDGGRKAWSFLIGAFMVEGLMWGEHDYRVLFLLLSAIGFPLTFGVFQRYYESNNTFSNSRHLPLVGTLATVSLPTSLDASPLMNIINRVYHTWEHRLLLHLLSNTLSTKSI
jgi:hypothetical protein